MLVANKTQALHKAIMLRVLTHILDDLYLSKALYFKGGICASMLGYLDRFSVDLDFDVKDKAAIKKVRKELENIFNKLDLTIKDSSNNVVQYFLRYDAPKDSRNTLKIDAVDTPYKNSKYEKVILPEINRYAICQTQDTLFANKLVATINRFEINKSIAGRDIYDIHHFLQAGYDYNKKLIEERRGVNADAYIKQLIEFIEINITQNIINQDLNFLLDYKKFNAIRKSLKSETISLLKDRLN